MSQPMLKNKMSPIIFFDVVETIFSLAPLDEEFLKINLPNNTGRMFLALLLRDAFAISSSNVFKTFPEIAKGTLTVMLDSLGRKNDEVTLQKILGAFSRLPAHEDVKSAFEKLKFSEIQIVLLTNGSRENTEKLVRANGLESFVDDIVSVEEFKVWKPHKALYQQAALKYACAAENALLIAAHAWDVHGAMCAGFKGIWIRRQESIFHPLMGRPDAEASNLIEAVDYALPLLKASFQH